MGIWFPTIQEIAVISKHQEPNPEKQHHTPTGQIPYSQNCRNMVVQNVMNQMPRDTESCSRRADTYLKSEHAADISIRQHLSYKTLKLKAKE